MKQIALLIGINQYQFVESVKYAEQDASAFSDALCEYCGFTENEMYRIIQGNGMVNLPTQRVIESRLRDIRDTSTDLDLLIVGFWGHGFIAPNSKRYLCAIDTEEEKLEQTGISLEALQSHIIQAGASNTLLILDCCQNYPGRGGSTNWTNTDKEELYRVQARDIMESRKKKGYSFDEQQLPRFGIMNACSAGQRAYEWEDRQHGIFTAHLLDALQNGYCSYRGISDYLSSHVKETSMRFNKRQTPTFRFEGSGDIQLGNGKSSHRAGPELVITPEDVSQVEIKDYQIEDIQLAMENISVPETQEPTLEEMGRIRLPAMPQKLRRTQSELLEIQRAIVSLESGEHPALAPAQASVGHAQDQLDRITRERERYWSVLSSSDSERLAESVRNNPEAAPTAFMALRPKEMPMPAFVMIILWEQKRLAAQGVLSKAKCEITEKRADAISGLRKQTIRTKTEYQEEAERFCVEVVDTVLSSCTGYDDYRAPNPYEELVPKLPVLEQYGLGWQEDSLWLLSEKRWKNDRPVVREEQERLERLEREKAEKERVEQERLARERGEGTKAGESKTLAIAGIEYVFRWCPPGTFMMGSPKTEKDRDDDETRHEVTLSHGFWMLESEVTQAMWESVMGNNPSYFKGPKLPVEQVSWDDCQEYIKRLNSSGECPNGYTFRLPSEAEWEYACRAGSTGAYGGTGDLKDMGWYKDNSGGKTHEVKTKQANAWGLYDMHGNVLEWCNDWYGDYPRGAVTDPTGPEGGSYRVYRGGGWSSRAGLCRSAYRNRSVPGGRLSDLGFRLALVPSK